MTGEMDYREAKNILYALAEEVINMTEEEKLFHLKKVVLAELKGNKNRFWTKMSKKMLVSPDLPSKILSNGELAA
jgi:hypothetical protein